MFMASIIFFFIFGSILFNPNYSNYRNDIIDSCSIEKELKYIYDTEEVFSPKEREELDSTLNQFQLETGYFMCIITKDVDLQPVDDGVLMPYLELLDCLDFQGVDERIDLVLTFSSVSRTAYFSVSDTIIADSTRERILHSVIIPEFQRSSYFDGVLSGIKETKEHLFM